MVKTSLFLTILSGCKYRHKIYLNIHTYDLIGLVLHALNCERPDRNSQAPTQRLQTRLNISSNHLSGDRFRSGSLRHFLSVVYREIIVIYYNFQPSSLNFMVFYHKPLYISKFRTKFTCIYLCLRTSQNFRDLQTGQRVYWTA